MSFVCRGRGFRRMMSSVDLFPSLPCRCRGCELLFEAQIAKNEVNPYSRNSVSETILSPFRRRLMDSSSEPPSQNRSFLRHAAREVRSARDRETRLICRAEAQHCLEATLDTSCRHDCARASSLYRVPYEASVTFCVDYNYVGGWVPNILTCHTDSNVFFGTGHARPSG